MRSTSLGLVALMVLVGCGGQTVALGGQSDGAEGGTTPPCPAGYICTPTGSTEGGPITTNGGVASIAAEIQAAPTFMVSDGSRVFWVSSNGPGGTSGLSSVSVNGGAISTVVAGHVSGAFLAVDDVNVYYASAYTNAANGLYRVPKSGGGSPARINDALPANTFINGETVLGTDLYWVEEYNPGPAANSTDWFVKRAPLAGGAVSTLAKFMLEIPGGGGAAIGVTTTTIFLSGPEPGSLSELPIGSGAPSSRMPAVVPGPHQFCGVLVSDADAVYCETGTSLVRVASDGKQATLGTFLSMGGPIGVAIDDTYLYWTDFVTVGTIMRVPKAGGTPTVIARDMDPIAIAVDAKAVYWSDQGGYIMRMLK